MSYNILTPQKFFGPQNSPLGSKYAKIARKLSNFLVLELQQVTGGSDKVAFVTKKLYLYELYYFNLPKNFLEPQIGPWGSKHAKIARKLSNFQVLELQQVTGGPDKVAFVTKKFHLDEMKIVFDKIFFCQEPSMGPRGQKLPKKGHFSSFYI